jgi:hypothetical protein
MALQLGYPTKVSAISGQINPETYPAWATITYEFPTRGDLPPVKLTWYEGARDGQRNLPRPELLMGETPSSSGAILIGEKGAMFSPNDYGGEQKLLPANQFEGYRPPEPSLPRIKPDQGIELTQKLERMRARGVVFSGEGAIGGDDPHTTEWVRAMRGGPPAMSNFDYAAVLTETMLLGNVAVRVGKALDYDADQMRVTNCPEAAEFISPTYRKGWEI